MFVHNYARFVPRATLEVLERHEITTMCAPPTVWRMLILEDLGRHRVKLREALSAGEPLNPEVIERVRQAWGITIRDGYGQTETTAQIGNSPGQPLKAGLDGPSAAGLPDHAARRRGRAARGGRGVHLARSAPGGAHGRVRGRSEPERVHHASRPLPHGRRRRAATPTATSPTSGRADDVFKSSDYRISPFELESALIEHDAIAEAAIVPSPDAVRGLVPKAFIILKPGRAPDRELALEIFRFLRRRLAPYKRVRRIEFSELPKTVSGKIRRVELQAPRGVPRARRATRAARVLAGRLPGDREGSVGQLIRTPWPLGRGRGEPARPARAAPAAR